MGFNYGLEKKNFDSQWAMTRKQYEDAGMSSEAIQAMYDFDWSVFNANRSYQNHTQEMAAPSFEQSEESYSPLMNKYQEAVSVTDTYHETKSRFLDDKLSVGILLAFAKLLKDEKLKIGRAHV